MNGIYQRDNLQIQAAIADALNRRERQLARQADRNNSNAEAIQNLMKAGGRWWETRDQRTIDEKIADLEKEKQLTLEAQKQQAQRQAFDRLAQSGKGLQRVPYDLRNDYARSMQGYYSKPDMSGYNEEKPLMRSIEEIDAELAKLKDAKARYDFGIPDRGAPEYRAGRFDYIVEGNRSGLDAYQQAVNNAVMQKIQREFQDQQRQANEAFQASENEKNRQVQREQAGLNRATEKAKMLRDYADAQALKSDIENNPSNYGSKVSLELAKADNNIALIKQNMLDSGMFTEADFETKTPKTPAVNTPETPEAPKADWNKDKPEAERLVKEGKFDEAQTILDRQNKDDSGLQSDLQKIQGDINAGKKKAAEAEEAKRFSKAKVDYVKKSLPSALEARKALDMGKAGGGKSEGIIKGKTFLYNGKNKEIGDIKVKKDGDKAKFYVDGEYVGEVELSLI